MVIPNVDVVWDWVGGTLTKILSATLLQKCLQDHYGSVLGHDATFLTLGKYII